MYRCICCCNIRVRVHLGLRQVEHASLIMTVYCVARVNSGFNGVFAPPTGQTMTMTTTSCLYDVDLRECIMPSSMLHVKSTKRRSLCSRLCWTIFEFALHNITAIENERDRAYTTSVIFFFSPIVFFSSYF